MNYHFVGYPAAFAAGAALTFLWLMRLGACPTPDGGLEAAVEEAVEDELKAARAKPKPKVTPRPKKAA